MYMLTIFFSLKLFIYFPTRSNLFAVIKKSFPETSQYIFLYSELTGAVSYDKN